MQNGRIDARLLFMSTAKNNLYTAFKAYNQTFFHFSLSKPFRRQSFSAKAETRWEQLNWRVFVADIIERNQALTVNVL